VPQKNRWHPCLLSDNGQRKLRQALVESSAIADASTRLEPDAEPENYDDSSQLPEREE
jgi:hypothetical protein